MAWAAAEEAKELNELDKQEKEPKEWQPSEQDKAWMEEEMRRAKELYGEDFGEDISEEFDG